MPLLTCVTAESSGIVATNLALLLELDQYLHQKDALIFLGPDASNIFDEIYFERHGIPTPMRQDIGEYPVLVDVERELQKMLEQQEDQAHGSPGKRKVGRNERCPCGSGLKFKRCHGR